MGWTLRLGQYITDEMQIPDYDVLVYTPQTRPIFLNGWLAWVLFHLSTLVGDLWLFRLFSSLVMLSMLALAFHLFRKTTRDLDLSLLGVLLILYTSVHLFHPRARIFTPPLFMLLFYMAHVQREGLGAPRIVAIMLLSALWMNLHTAASSFLAFLCVSSLGAALENVFARKHPSHRFWFRQALLTGGVFLALFATPETWDWISETIHSYGVNRARSIEWHDLFRYQAVLDGVFRDAPPAQHPLFTRLLGLPFSLWVSCAIGVSFAACVVGRRRTGVSIEEAVIGAWAVYAAFSLQRLSWLLFIPIFYVLRSVASASPGVHLIARSGRTLVPVLSLTLIVAVFLPIVRPAEWHEFSDDGWDSRRVPTGAARFLDEAQLHGNLFHDLDWGGYLAHRLFPRSKVYMAGHWAEAAPDVIRDYDQMIAQGSGLRRIIQKYGADIAVLPTTWRSVEAALGEKWVRVFADRRAKVFLRASDTTRLNACLAYYEQIGVSFSPSEGFQRGRAIREAPRWAERFGL